MKKLILQKIAIFITVLNFASMTHTQDNPIQESQAQIKIINFIPDEAFGGLQAQGQYIKKSRTATIAVDNNILKFNHIIENPNPNPKFKSNKLNLIKLGFFHGKMTRADMPITTYLFGLRTKESHEA